MNDLTERMIAYVQCMMCYGISTPRYRARLERIETYLIGRFNRGMSTGKAGGT